MTVLKKAINSALALLDLEVRRKVEKPGAPFPVCGVWRGGNALLAAGIFKLHRTPRRVYLFDTFTGMTEPAQVDTVAATGELARTMLSSNQRETHNEWCYASLDDVKDVFRQADLLNPNVVFVKGDVLQTLAVPENVPQTISVLRLDTDWYESTKLELETLYPRLSVGGVIMIDDYGYWTGARKATDEYFAREIVPSSSTRTTAVVRE